MTIRRCNMPCRYYNFHHRCQIFSTNVSDKYARIFVIQECNVCIRFACILPVSACLFRSVLDIKRAEQGLVIRAGNRHRLQIPDHDTAIMHDMVDLHQ
jgi:hypothetical protein